MHLGNLQPGALRRYLEEISMSVNLKCKACGRSTPHAYDKKRPRKNGFPAMRCKRCGREY